MSARHGRESEQNMLSQCQRIRGTTQLAWDRELKVSGFGVRLPSFESWFWL